MSGFNSCLKHSAGHLGPLYEPGLGKAWAFGGLLRHSDQAHANLLVDLIGQVEIHASSFGPNLSGDLRNCSVDLVNPHIHRAGVHFSHQGVIDDIMRGQYSVEFQDLNRGGHHLVNRSLVGAFEFVLGQRPSALFVSVHRIDTSNDQHQ